MNATYRQLLKRLNELPDERLDDNISVYSAREEEYIPVTSIYITETDVLDKGHLVLEIDY